MSGVGPAGRLLSAFRERGRRTRASRVGGIRRAGGKIASKKDCAEDMVS